MTTPTTVANRPGPGTWLIDRSHTTIGFAVRHLMITKVRGRFSEFGGTVTIGETIGECSVEVSILAASVDTRDPQRDEHLRSPDFFNVEQFPTITFRSTRIRDVDVDSGRFALDGDLTIRGATLPVALNVEYGGLVNDPWGGERAAFEAQAEVDRVDWGLVWNVPLESGGFVVGKKVNIEIDVELVRQ